MQSFRKFMYILGLLVFVGATAFVLTNYYPWIFSKNVVGQIYQVERVTQPTMLVGAAAVQSATAMFSFAVAIRGEDGTIYTASSEDRQWAVARRGLCVTAKFYPYPPWDLEKGGTYANARLTGLKECPPNMPAIPEVPAMSAPTNPSEAAPAEAMPE